MNTSHPQGILHVEGFNKRDRSDSLDRAYTDHHGSSPSRLHDLVWESENFLPGSAERQQSLEMMHTMLMERTKKMRDGPGPNSYKQNDGDILDAFYMGNDTSGNLDNDAAGSGLGFHDGLQYDIQDRFPGDSFGSFSKSNINSGFFAMDDVCAEQALSNSFKESVSFTPRDDPSGILPFSPPGMSVSQQQQKATRPAAKAKNVPQVPGFDSDEDATHAPVPAPVAKPPTKTTAAAMLGSNNGVSTAATALTSAPTSATSLSASLLDENTERLSHKEVEQRRREKAKIYFDELRALLPCGADSKFDKNTILQNTIAMIKQLQADLDYHREAKMGGKRTLTQPCSQDYRTSFDVTRQPLCFCGLDGFVWESNAAFCSLMGYGKQEISGLSLLQSTAPADSDASSQQWQRLISNGMCNSAFYCHLIRKDSQQLLVNMDLNLIHKKNQPYCFLVATNPTS